MAMPGTVASAGRIWFCARSNSWASEAPLPFTASCRIGTVDAL